MIRFIKSIQRIDKKHNPDNNAISINMYNKKVRNLAYLNTTP
jgi:hypothetical protein